MIERTPTTGGFNTQLKEVRKLVDEQRAAMEKQRVDFDKVIAEQRQLVSALKERLDFFES